MLGYACAAASMGCDVLMPVSIHFRSAEGSELEEQWPSPDAFINWAIGEGLSGAYTVYEEDEDGDWPMTLKGVIE